MERTRSVRSRQAAAQRPNADGEGTSRGGLGRGSKDAIGVNNEWIDGGGLGALAPPETRDSPFWRDWGRMRTAEGGRMDRLAGAILGRYGPRCFGVGFEAARRLDWRGGDLTLPKGTPRDNDPWWGRHGEADEGERASR